MGSDPVTVPPPPTLPLEEMTAALSEEEARAILPDLARKIKAGKVTFDDIVECHYEAEPITPLAPPQAGGSADPAVSKRRRAFAALLEPATDAFHAAHPIESMFFCEKVESAAALVRSPRMKAGSLPGWFPAPRGDDWEIRYSLDWTAEDKEILPYLNRCASLAIQSDRLPRVESITAKRVIFEAYCSALDALDKRRERANGLTKDEILEIGNQIREAETDFEGSATAQANTLYFLGTLWGVALILLIYDAVSFIASRAGQSDLLGPLSPLTLSFGAGAAGATLSVMQRMGSAEGLVKNYRAPGSTLRLFGILRPLVGAFVGTAFHLLIRAGLVPLAVPADAGAALYFFIGVAFLAGFSERWAKDILEKPPAGLGNPTSAPSEDQPAPH